MNKKEFINVISKKFPMSKLELNVLLEVIFDTIIWELKKGESIRFNKFGIFKIKQMKERIAHNPQTGEKIIISPYFKPTFKFSKKVKKIINKDIKINN